MTAPARRPGHYAYGLRDGGSEWHVGAATIRDCHFDECRALVAEWDDLARLRARASADGTGLRIRGHGGLIDQLRQRVAGLGADVLSLELAEAKGNHEAHVGAIGRARSHLAALDAIMSAALEAAAHGEDDEAWVVGETCRKCGKAMIWRGPDRYNGQYAHADGDRTHAARPASRLVTAPGLEHDKDGVKP